MRGVRASRMAAAFGARVAVDVVLNRRYAGTHCSVWRYLLVSLTPVEKGA